MSSLAFAATAGLDFDRTFGGPDDGRQSYYAATYQVDGHDHRMEVWRDGDRRITRRTDDTVETHLARRPDDTEWTMTVLDLRRKIRTDIDRTNLMRIGHFTDWFAQAHALSRPRGTYRLVPTVVAPEGKAPVAACRWYRLTEAGRTSRLCWSATNRVPLEIMDAQGRTVWRVTRLSAGPFPASVFAIDDRGLVHNDANQDIEAD